MSKGWKYGVGLGIVIVLLFVANLLIGSVTIPVSDVFRILMGNEGEKASWMGVPLTPSLDGIALRKRIGCLRVDVADSL